VTADIESPHPGSPQNGSGVLVEGLASKMPRSQLTAPELRELRYFVAVAEELHFTHAADRLSIAQQALSAAIRQFEKRLGGSLFVRTTRSVRLSPAGVALLPKARAALAAADEAMAAARGAIEGTTGHLRVGVSRPAHRFGAAIMRALVEHAPLIEVELRHAFSTPLVDAVLSEDLDAAIVFCADQLPALWRVRLSDQPAVVAMHPDHRLAERAALSVEDLRAEIFALAPESIGRAHNCAVLVLCQAAGFTPATVESGYLLPTASHDTVSIVTEATLDGVPLPFEVARVPLIDQTLPFDLVFRAGDGSPALRTLRVTAEATARRERWPRND
jgi:DNA-binding transcriptional LysR family regulator